MCARHRRLALSSLLRVVLVVVVLSSVIAVRPPASVAQEETPTEVATDTPTTEPSPTVAPTETPAPTDTPQPTETPQPTNTPQPAATLAPTDTAAPTELPTSTPTPSPAETAPATSTPTVNPTAKPEDQQVAAATYAVKILSVDINGNPVSGNCFDIHLDAGDGSPGTLVLHDECGGDILVHLAAAKYVLVETKRPDEVAKAANRHFTVTGARSITVTHDLLTTIVVTAKDNATGLPISIACFKLIPLVPDYPEDTSCDHED